MAFFKGFGPRAGGGTAITEYATVAALNTAAEGSLPAGYYAVPGEWVLVYWSGTAFTQGTTQVTATHQQIQTSYPTVEEDI